MTPEHNPCFEKLIIRGGRQSVVSAFVGVPSLETMQLLWSLDHKAVGTLENVAVGYCVLFTVF